MSSAARFIKVPRVTSGDPIQRRPIPSWGALALSFFIPGLGQLVAGRVAIGVTWFVLFLSAFPTLVWVAASPRFSGFALAFGLFAGFFILWIGMLVQAYRSGNRNSEANASRPWIAALLSGIWPGLGQLYNREICRGLLFVVAVIVAGAAPKAVALVIMFSLWVWATIDAFRASSRKLGVESHRLRFMGTAVVASLVLFALVALLIRFCWIHPFKIPTGAMSPTLLGNRTENGAVKTGDHLSWISFPTSSLNPSGATSSSSEREASLILIRTSTS